MVTQAREPRVLMHRHKDLRPAAKELGLASIALGLGSGDLGARVRYLGMPSGTPSMGIGVSSLTFMDRGSTFVNSTLSISDLGARVEYSCMPTEDLIKGIELLSSVM